MKITKRQLRRIIREEKARLVETSNWKPLSKAHADELGAKQDPHSRAMAKSVSELLQRALNTLVEMGYDDAAEHVEAALEEVGRF